MDAGGDMDFDAYPDSVTSSVMNHVYEGGLRYHAYRDGKYAYPNGELEQQILDMKSALWSMILHGALITAPVEEILKIGGQVFDLGTGTGSWCIELGEMFPESYIRGVDLSPIQPTLLPPNVAFFVDDFEDDWEYPENYFDYIHIRDTMHAVRDRDLFLQRIYKHLKPGGYVEVQEIDYAIYCDDDSMGPENPNALTEFCEHLRAGLAALGVPNLPNTSTPDALVQAGFDDVAHDPPIKCPVGGWPRDPYLKQCGLLTKTILLDGLKNLAQRPFGAKGLGWTQERIELFLMEVRQAVTDKSVHGYTKFHVVYGRKPLFERR